MTDNGLQWLLRPEARRADVRWHDLGEAAPAVTTAPADGVGVASYTATVVV